MITALQHQEMLQIMKEDIGLFLSGCRVIALGQCFSSGIPWNLRVLRVAAKGSTETDRNCLDKIHNHSSKRL